jgi:hypothetical protein
MSTIEMLLMQLSTMFATFFILWYIVSPRLGRLFPNTGNFLSEGKLFQVITALFILTILDIILVLTGVLK